jgi:hypothetical protein
MSEITTEDVERFEKLAGLTLSADRRQGVADILNAWIPAANELSEKMAARQHRALTPAVRFSDPDIEEGVGQ